MSWPDIGSGANSRARGHKWRIVRIAPCTAMRHSTAIFSGSGSTHPMISNQRRSGGILSSVCGWQYGHAALGANHQSGGTPDAQVRIACCFCLRVISSKMPARMETCMVQMSPALSARRDTDVGQRRRNSLAHP